MNLTSCIQKRIENTKCYGFLCYNICHIIAQKNGLNTMENTEVQLVSQQIYSLKEYYENKFKKCVKTDLLKLRNNKNKNKNTVTNFY